MLANVPVCVGVPVSSPVVALKLAQAGMLDIEKVRVVPLGALVAG
jgi:hypothetical protein